MTDAVKMALEALADIRTSIECATGCDEGIDPMAAVSEIMSAYGTAMASAYSRAADMVNILAALEQAGEPVADFYYPIEMPLNADGHGPATVGEDATTMTFEVWDQFCDSHGRFARLSDAIQRARQLNALPTLQRLGQEFDAGEVKRKPVIMKADRKVDADALRTLAGYIESSTYLKPGNMTSWDDVLEGIRRHYLYAHPPQSRVAAEPVGLREAVEGIDDDYMTSEKHHPGYVLIPTAKFEQIVAATERAKGIVPPHYVNWHHDADQALATLSQPDPQSRGQAFDGEGDVYAIMAALSEYDPTLYEQESWEITLMNVKPIIAAALSSAKRGEEG